jgi:hypothetical protein
VQKQNEHEPLAHSKLEEELSSKTTQDERLKYLIQQTQNVVCDSIKTSLNQIDEFNKNPENFILSSKDIDISKDQWSSASDSDKDKNLTFVKRALYFNVFSKRKDHEQLDCCLELMDINLLYAAAFYGEITKNITQNNVNDLILSKQISEIENIRKQIDKLNGLHQFKNELKQKTMSELIDTYRKCFNSEPSLLWLCNENAKFKEVVIKFYSARLSYLVTKAKLEMDYPPELNSQSIENNALENKLKFLLKYNAEYIIDYISPNETPANQITQCLIM